MSLKAYEDACVRAELFGQPIPIKEEFLETHKHLDVVEFEEVDIKNAENNVTLNENLREAGGGLNELNTILTSTQSKINRLKGVCGTLTNFFRTKLTAKDNLSYSTEPSYVGQTNYDKDYVPPANSTSAGLMDTNLVVNESTPMHTHKKNGSDINAALKDLDEMQIAENTTVLKSAVGDVNKQIDSQMGKLDQMICQADRAQSSINHQNKQMRSFLR